MRNWNFDTLEREVRANLVYRVFTRVGAEKVPDAKTLARIECALGPEVFQKVQTGIVGIAREKKAVVHDNQHPICLQDRRFTMEQVEAPQTVLHMTDERQPRATATCAKWDNGFIRFSVAGPGPGIPTEELLTSSTAIFEDDSKPERVSG